MSTANTMRVELVSPERILFSGEATMVVTRVVGGGDIAIFPKTLKASRRFWKPIPYSAESPRSKSASW